MLWLTCSLVDLLLLCDIITTLCHYIMASLCQYIITELTWLHCQVVIWLLDCVPCCSVTDYMVISLPQYSCILLTSALTHHFLVHISKLSCGYPVSGLHHYTTLKILHYHLYYVTHFTALCYLGSFVSVL